MNNWEWKETWLLSVLVVTMCLWNYNHFNFCTDLLFWVRHLCGEKCKVARKAQIDMLIFNVHGQLLHGCKWHYFNGVGVLSNTCTEKPQCAFLHVQGCKKDMSWWIEFLMYVASHSGGGISSLEHWGFEKCLHCAWFILCTLKTAANECGTCCDHVTLQMQVGFFQMVCSDLVTDFHVFAWSTTWSRLCHHQVVCTKNPGHGFPGLLICKKPVMNHNFVTSTRAKESWTQVLKTFNLQKAHKSHDFIAPACMHKESWTHAPRTFDQQEACYEP